MSPARVLLVTGSLGPGGTELAVAALARGLARRGRVAPEVAVLGTAGAYGAALVADGVPVHELAIEGPLRTPTALLRLSRLAGLVRAGRRAILHTFLFDADVYGMLAARLGAPRAVITTRRAIKSHREDHLRAYRWTNPLVDRIVANSEAVRRFTIDVERAPERKVMTIPNGVDTERFASADGAAARARLGIPEGARVVGAVGTLKPVKGQDVLLEAAWPLLAADPSLVVVLAGTISRGYGEELQRRAAERGFAGRVLFPGALDDVPGLLAALDVFVLPSLSEGMSNALLEAMAAGRAIVATTVGGNAENLDGGTAGLLVPPRDADALRSALARLLASREWASTLGTAARDRARRTYALPLLFERTEALYDELGAA